MLNVRTIPPSDLQKSVPSLILKIRTFTSRKPITNLVPTLGKSLGLVFLRGISLTQGMHDSEGVVLGTAQLDQLGDRFNRVLGLIASTTLLNECICELNGLADVAHEIIPGPTPTHTIAPNGNCPLATRASLCRRRHQFLTVGTPLLSPASTLLHDTSPLVK